MLSLYTVGTLLKPYPSYMNFNCECSAHVIVKYVHFFDFNTESNTGVSFYMASMDYTLPGLLIGLLCRALNRRQNDTRYKNHGYFTVQS
jgi:hypothetical protein